MAGLGIGAGAHQGDTDRAKLALEAARINNQAAQARAQLKQRQAEAAQSAGLARERMAQQQSQFDAQMDFRRDEFEHKSGWDDILNQQRSEAMEQQRQQGELALQQAKAEFDERQNARAEQERLRTTLGAQAMYNAFLNPSGATEPEVLRKLSEATGFNYTQGYWDDLGGFTFVGNGEDGAEQTQRLAPDQIEAFKRSYPGLFGYWQNPSRRGSSSSSWGSGSSRPASSRGAGASSRGAGAPSPAEDDEMLGRYELAYNGIIGNNESGYWRIGSNGKLEEVDENAVRALRKKLGKSDATESLREAASRQPEEKRRGMNELADVLEAVRRGGGEARPYETDGKVKGYVREKDGTFFTADNGRKIEKSRVYRNSDGSYFLWDGSEFRTLSGEEATRLSEEAKKKGGM